MSKKTKYKPKPFESMGENFLDNTGKKRMDTSAGIYESMLLSEAYKSLTTRQKMLYVYCKAQFWGKRKPGRDYPDNPEVQGDEFFYLNLSLIVNYGLYTRNMGNVFYQDMKVLEQVGFIERVARNKGGKRKAIYKFSDKWKKYDTSNK